MKECKSEFITVKCEKCKNEQIIFSKPASDIKCLVCGTVLCKSTGGTGEMKAKVLKDLE